MRSAIRSTSRKLTWKIKPRLAIMAAWSLLAYWRTVYAVRSSGCCLKLAGAWRILKELLEAAKATAGLSGWARYPGHVNWAEQDSWLLESTWSFLKMLESLLETAWSLMDVFQEDRNWQASGNYLEFGVADFISSAHMCELSMQIYSYFKRSWM